MDIKIYINHADACMRKGLLDSLFMFADSISKKIPCAVHIDADAAADEGNCIITVGGAYSPLQSANIPSGLPLKETADKLFDIAGTLLYGKCRQLTVKLFNIPSGWEETLAELENSYSGNIGVFTYSEGLITTFRITGTENGGAFDAAVSDIFSAFKKNIYAEGDISPGCMLSELLTVRNKKLSVAESLTGGLIADTLIDNAGASAYFYEGLITYSNEAKIKRLNIDENIIKKYGAVSYETAYEMAAGLLLTKMCDIALATTGIAGPSGGSLTKPVGLTFIAVGSVDGIHVYKHVFSGDRQQVREAAAYSAMFYAVKRLKDNSWDYEELQIK